jgi:hypothetical protein
MLDGSKPDWNLIGHPEAPPGSPNVLLVLIDDADFGSIGELSSGFPGYTAAVPRDCTPLPRILTENGYSTAAFAPRSSRQPSQPAGSGSEPAQRRFH